MWPSDMAYPRPDLVDGGPVALLHLVELIDAAHAIVGQDQGASLQGHLDGEKAMKTIIHD